MSCGTSLAVLSIAAAPAQKAARPRTSVTENARPPSGARGSAEPQEPASVTLPPGVMEAEPYRHLSDQREGCSVWAAPCEILFCRDLQESRMGTTSVPNLSRPDADAIFDALLIGQGAVWRNPAPVALVVEEAERARIETAAQRFARFAPLLRRLFPDKGWDGVIESALLDYAQPSAGLPTLRVKADHDLPMTGSIQARGGVYELLTSIERIAGDEALLERGDGLEKLLEPEEQPVRNLHSVAVASTNNLGYCVGLVARAIGLAAEIHVSSDAKAWKVDRLRALDAHNPGPLPPTHVGVPGREPQTQPTSLTVTPSGRESSKERLSK